MVASFSNDFKKYQKRERLLTSTIVLIAALAPVCFTFLIQQKVHWVISLLFAVVMIVAAAWIHIYRDHIAKKILRTYENIEIGSVLAKKISSRTPSRYVVVNRGHKHFYLQCLGTGEQVLVSKNKVHEDFNITN